MFPVIGYVLASQAKASPSQEGSREEVPSPLVETQENLLNLSVFSEPQDFVWNKLEDASAWQGLGPGQSWQSRFHRTQFEANQALAKGDEALALEAWHALEEDLVAWDGEGLGFRATEIFQKYWQGI
ncbi:MAG: hypothetical protein KDK66_09460, partial [Deltaproteobacteria bacterium]|nr:hypothetical protein [Deltaproteobacteria bacterium]